MSVKSIFAAALLLVGAPFLASSQNARLPYRQIYDVEKTQAQLNQTYSNLVIALTLQSITPGVETSNLTVYIEAKAGKIPVDLGGAGEFTIPLRDDLLAQNPWIVVNQPRGTMKLNWKVGVVLGKLSRTLHYSRLMQPVRDSQVVEDQMLRFFPNSPKLVTAALKLTFPSGRQSAVAVIHLKDGDRKLMANQSGEIILPLDPDLMQEDPEITLSDLPGIVEIVSHTGSK